MKNVSKENSVIKGHCKNSKLAKGPVFWEEYTRGRLTTTKRTRKCACLKHVITWRTFSKNLSYQLDAQPVWSKQRIRDELLGGDSMQKESTDLLQETSGDLSSGLADKLFKHALNCKIHLDTRGVLDGESVCNRLKETQQPGFYETGWGSTMHWSGLL